MRIRLLGDFAVWVNGRLVPVSAWRLRKARDLVKVLALAPQHRLHREQAMEYLWPERKPQAAANSLHQALHVARKAMSRGGEPGQRILALREGFLSLCHEDDLWVDVVEFDDALRRARAEPGLQSLQAARGLYAGALLPEDPYEEWALEPRERLRGDYLTLLSELATLYAADGDREAAVDALRDLLEHDPLDEAAHRGLMLLYAQNGKRRAALRQYQLLRATLRRELDVDLAEESERLHREILEGTVGHDAALAAPPEPSRPRAARTARPARPVLPGNNLPLQLSSFVGRRREMAAIRRLLGRTRVLSLTGPGGCGKTRLAIEVAAALDGDDFPDGVWLVQLAAVTDPRLVVQATAEVFAVREQPGTPLVQLLAAHIEYERLLLVLDNCEHVIEACAETAQALAAACPNVQLMITSRRPLRIPGEVVFQVPPLSVPEPAALPTLEPERLAEFEAVRLFVERAQLVSPAFALTARTAPPVAELCYHLDGLPLALELAASRTAALPVDAIAERLGDRFRLLVAGSRTALKRHQTLKATLDWSYGLLDDREQSLLRALACFTGGVALDAAERVSAIGVEGSEVADLLGRLVEQSMLSVDDDAKDARYRLLETVREYGQELLDRTGERAAVEARHADWFLDLAEQTAEAIPTAGREPWLARLELEHDNVRAALDRMVSADPERALRLAAAMWPFWLWRGYLVEGRRRLDQAIALVRDPTPLRGEALLGATAITIRSGVLAEGIALAEQTLAMLREIGRPRAVCRLLNLLGMATWSQDELGRSGDLFAESLSVATEAGFGPGRAAALHALGIVRWYANEAREADALLEQSLALFRSLADSSELAPPMLDVAEFLVPQPGTGGFRIVWEESFSPIVEVPCATAAGYVLANRGMIARTDGDFVHAREYLEAALALFEGVGDARAIAQAMARLGNLARVEGDFATARDLLQESLTIRTRLGETRSATLTTGSLGNLAAAAGDFAAARKLLRETADTFQRRGDRWGYASALSDLASLALLEGDPPEAIRLLEEALEVIDETGRRRWKAWALVQLAAARKQAGDEPGARERLDDALALFRRIGDRRGVVLCLEIRAGRVEPARS